MVGTEWVQSQGPEVSFWSLIWERESRHLGHSPFPGGLAGRRIGSGAAKWKIRVVGSGFSPVILLILLLIQLLAKAQPGAAVMAQVFVFLSLVSETQMYLLARGFNLTHQAFGECADIRSPAIILPFK